MKKAIIVCLSILSLTGCETAKKNCGKYDSAAGCGASMVFIAPFEVAAYAIASPFVLVGGVATVATKAAKGDYSKPKPKPNTTVKPYTPQPRPAPKPVALEILPE